MRKMAHTMLLEDGHKPLFRSIYRLNPLEIEEANTSRKTAFHDNFVSFRTHHSKHFRQLGRIISNIHVTLDHFLVILDSVTKDHVFY